MATSKSRHELRRGLGSYDQLVGESTHGSRPHTGMPDDREQHLVLLRRQLCRDGRCLAERQKTVQLVAEPGDRYLLSLTEHGCFMLSACHQRLNHIVTRCILVFSIEEQPGMLESISQGDVVLWAMKLNEMTDQGRMSFDYLMLGQFIRLLTRKDLLQIHGTLPQSELEPESFFRHTKAEAG